MKTINLRNYYYPRYKEDVLVGVSDEERFFLLTLERLDEALSHLTPAQERRIRARYLDGKKTKEIAEAERVNVHVIYESLQRGLKSLQRYFAKKKWREFEE